MRKTHATLILTAIALTAALIPTPARAGDPDPGAEPAASTAFDAILDTTENLLTFDATSGGAPRPAQPTDAWFTTAPLPTTTTGDGTANLMLPGMTSLMQPADPDYDEWRASMDAARGKRRRGMIMTFGGLLGAPLVGGLVAGGSAAAGSEAGIGVGAAIYLAGIGVGVWGIFEWINGHSDIGDIELDGRRAGYVSITPVAGGAAATLAFAF
ncbi:MAG: hypothetical protein OXG35_21535 [Acidobacteria bacterium]|nr:hypothetical protein [Acidobacteriota bacterium]